MLLLRHPLATLLDDRTHCVTPRSRDVTPVPDLITAGACHRTTPECYRASLIDASPEGLSALNLSKGHLADFDKRRPDFVEGPSPRSTPKRLTTRLVS
jgi:high-affinity K+ transport system ATPase subunit B